MEASNVKAMREALENSNGLLEELATIGEWGESAREQIAENNAALSAPPRNCDVGTAEEQAERLFRRYGDTTIGAEVALLWAAMPYDEGGAE